jgi:hypothetical protein
MIIKGCESSVGAVELLWFVLNMTTTFSYPATRFLPLLVGFIFSDYLL